MNYTYVDTPDCFEKMLDSLKNARYIAFDTEFFREVTFFPKLALFQMAADGEIFLVDPFAVNFAELLSFIVMTDAVMICHASAEDLEIVSEHARREGLSRILPRNIFDTQAAAAFLGYGNTIGLAAIIEKTLGITLEKTETRTDWLRRPLTEAQLEYAALDVAYLEPLMNYLIQEMEKKPEILKWFRMHMDTLSHSQDPENVLAPDRLYLKLRKTGRFNQNQLRVLQAITVLRDQVCRDNDIPASHFIRNNVLVPLVAGTAIFDQSVYVKNGVHYSIVRRYGTLIQRTAREANARHDAAPLPPTYDVVNYSCDSKCRKALDTFLQDRSSRLGFSKGVLDSQRLLENFFYAPLYEKKYPILQQGWYLDCLGDLSSFFSPEAHRLYIAGELSY
ncbi:ribonuclease D [Succinimonas amylolytica]|uniref:ribonuclease D n=1 Tax=Succinimonas amylolytica TaxID=83769 RepID=UPI00035FF940|nr:ribonuclease D [Succinimonas amylolytica]